jgi:hypothetical protein
MEKDPSRFAGAEKEEGGESEGVDLHTARKTEAAATL